VYTLPMSWSFRTLVLSLAALWALAPQIACFMPGQMTQAEQECCQQMGGDCAGSGMSHECCQTVVRPDVGTLAKLRDVMPDDNVAERVFETESFFLFVGSHPIAAPADETPPAPSGISSVILRI